MDVTIDLSAIPPHPEAGQKWLLAGRVVLVLAVQHGGDHFRVATTSYAAKGPLTFSEPQVEEVDLKAFVARTHRLGAQLLEGPGAPWFGEAG